MKGLRITLLIFVCLVLSNCKLSFNANEDVVDIEGEGKFYVGDIDSFHYFHGGWYGPIDMPNYSMDLKLEVVNSGKVKATLDTPECKLSGRLSANAYSNLVNMVEEAKKEKFESFMIDGGVETITLSSESNKEVYHLFKGDHALVPQLLINKEDGDKIKKRILKLADKLKERYGCGEEPVQSKIKVLHLKQTLLNQAPKMSAAGIAQLPLPGNVRHPFPAPEYNTKRDFKIYNDNGVLRVSGTERVNRGHSFCHRSLDNEVIDSDIINEMEKIKITQAEVICMMVPHGNSSTSIRLTYKSGQSKIGYEGCWNSSFLSNHIQFMDKFQKWLSQKPQVCGAY